MVNLFCYGQVESPYGSGEFYRVARRGASASEHETLVLSEIEDKEGDLRVDQDVSGQREIIDWSLVNGHVESRIDNAESTMTNDNHDHRTPFEPLPPNLAEIQRQIEGACARATGSTSSRRSSKWSIADQLNAIAAYGGFPTRYPHWRFGMEYEQLTQGLPLRAAEDLRDGDQQRPVLRLPDAVATTLVDQKLVMAHVYGHCDFFKNNFWFSQTNRKMMDEMANHGNRIRRYMDRGWRRGGRGRSSTPA